MQSPVHGTQQALADLANKLEVLGFPELRSVSGVRWCEALLWSGSLLEIFMFFVQSFCINFGAIGRHWNRLVLSFIDQG